jgi:DNA-directed RNA polymerase subunit RPC12/RpoP
MYCRNLDCHKLVPHDSLFCPYCGGREFTKLKGSESDDLSMENFQKIVESTEAISEKSIQPKKQKPTLNSRFAVRKDAVVRKLPLPKKQGWRPGQADRKRNILIGIAVGAVILFFVL